MRRTIGGMMRKMKNIGMRLAGPSLRALACSMLLSAASQPAGAADLANGQRLFATRCASCHKVGPNAHGGFGPQLNALFGRRAGATPGYAYSAALQQSRIVWDDASLRAYLADPDEAVPGTKMRFWGISDARKLDDLLAYLRSFGPPAPSVPSQAPVRR